MNPRRPGVLRYGSNALAAAGAAKIATRRIDEAPLPLFVMDAWTPRSAGRMAIAGGGGRWREGL